MSSIAGVNALRRTICPRINVAVRQTLTTTTNVPPVSSSPGADLDAEVADRGGCCIRSGVQTAP